MHYNDNASKAWYLVFTKPRMELLAQGNLERQNYQTYLPRIAVKRRLRGRYKKHVEVMFPRYLFIHLDTVHDNWMPIRSTLGVSQLVRFGGMPLQVPDALVAELQNQQDESGLNIVPIREIIHGDQVEIMDGPMSGYIGVFEKHTSTERVQILLKIVGEYTRVNIDINNIQIAV